MNQKAIIAIENKKLLKNIKNNNLKLEYKKVQYREAIIEILKKEKNIQLIFISENIPGEISIEKLIEKIKLINKEIKIIFFLKTKNKKKEEKLKNLKVNNIYYIKKIKNKKIKNKKRKIKKDEIKNRIITIYGPPNSGKTTIANLLLYYLIKKNKKILLINLNNKIEKSYLNLLRKKQINSNVKKLEVILNNNLKFLFNIPYVFKYKKENNKFNEIIKYYFRDYEYIIVDIGKNSNKFIKKELLKNSNIKIIVGSDNLLEITDVQQLINKLYIKEKNQKVNIIQNKFFANSFCFFINKYNLKKVANVYRIFKNNKLKNLSQKILNGEKIKLNKLIERKIKKIIN